MLRSLFLAPFAVAVASAATLSERQSSCLCGYKDSTGAVWRESFTSDFTTGWSTALNQNFNTSHYLEKHTPYNMQYNRNNVYGYNDGLGMKTSAFSGGSTDPVNVAGIITKRKDFTAGSFRMRATVPSVPGVCFGFFTYVNDTQEADIEFLSSDADYYQRVHHTNQPGLLNGDTDPQASRSVVIPGADFTAFHEHRLDWLPDATKYFYDGSLKSTLTKNSPKVASPLLVNVWSDGSSGWTQGPPTQDAIATIYYIKAYFNSTLVSESQFNTQCAAASSKTPCSVKLLRPNKLFHQFSLGPLMHVVAEARLPAASSTPLENGRPLINQIELTALHGGAIRNPQNASFVHVVLRVPRRVTQWFDGCHLLNCPTPSEGDRGPTIAISLGFAVAWHSFNTMVRSLFLIPLAATIVSAATLAERQSTCACGYKDSTGAIWRESFASDFTTGWSAALSQNFYKFGWAENHANAPYAMQYNTDNAYGYNSGLGLKTSAFTSGSVQTAGIGSLRSDILYGSFRMRATVPSVPGVCFGFFTYKDDTQEADIEFLSSDSDYYQRAHHTNQPGLVNGNTDPNAYHSVVIPGADFTAFHEHRLDWLPSSSKYYYDGSLKSTVSKNSPSVPSSLLTNVWSDGSSGWTKGPPTRDAIATIYYIKAYFNSTSLTDSQFRAQCAASSNKAPCSI
ncbi:Glycoside hydrolase family 16 protein [Ceratobasidium theobromae]|uniref:Glycoside hydrolase family 16 protein n=1 Tax=Ceratobasidium theobromae TaxID=1582974 RepID=A0A5N5QFK9_9AGAM|nr:Glycoside hydrolase family 16 protein [Ceratobasidium theobromae]